MAERTNAQLLKSCEVQASVGSNPTPSAKWPEPHLGSQAYESLVVSYQEVVMPKRYARDFRRAVCVRLVAGEKVSSLSKELGVSEPTLYHWKRQALIDAGRAEGIKSFEADELAQALKTIAELEAELEAVKAAGALFNRAEIVGSHR